MKKKTAAQRYLRRLEKLKQREDAGDDSTALDRSVRKYCTSELTTQYMVANMARLRRKVRKRIKEGFLPEDSDRKSYRQMCTLLQAAEFRQRKCCPGGQSKCAEEEKRICCQHTTQNGERCKRPASRFLSVDLSLIHI